MINVKFIPSLHRPFNQQLKAVKWVCAFIKSRKEAISSSALNIEFYLFLINKLNNEYKTNTLEEYNGIPSQEAVSEIFSTLNKLSKSEKIITVSNAVKGDREAPLEKQIYSTYKAASYFVNMAKDKFSLIDAQNKLSTDGRRLLSIRSGFFKYTDEERVFYFKKILESDFHLFISLCYFIKLADKYDYKDYVKIQFEFLDKFYGIRHFNFTSSSLANYNTVRNFWITILNVLDKNNSIRKRYHEVIESNSQYKLMNDDLKSKVERYEQDEFKKQKIFFTNKTKFEKLYEKCVKSGSEELGFVNLYDIKANIRMSHEAFEQFISKYYEQEKGKKHIFFSNIVSSIDRRKRFKVRGVSVLKIKIK